MLPRSLDHSLRRLWTLDTFAYSVRVFIALAGAMAWSWHLGGIAQLIPLFLGVIASALAETDDHWQGRLTALAVTLACFAVAALSVEWLFDRPPAFAAGLALSAFGLTMLGAVGPRYGTIAHATLILSIYTMIAIERQGGVAPGELWREPAMLLAGAAWYGLISVVWCALFARQPLKLSLALLLRELGEYLRLKATLFEPVRGIDLEARRLALAEQNARVVEALNQAKEMIFRRLEGARGTHKLDRYLRLYFIAQDIHERASSSHYPYGELTEAFFHHDVLFRCQRLLEQQGQACRSLARALLLRQPFDHGPSEQALADLDASLDYLHRQPRRDGRRLLHSLDALADNLRTLEHQLAGARNPDAPAAAGDAALHDRSPRGPRDIYDRLRSHLTPASPIFRHALRLSLTLLAGYGLLLWIHPTQGYWILLTSLFVCRPNFGATRRFLWQRIVGTVAGLVAGWALISLFPDPLIQLSIAVVAGVVFFAARARHYALATAAITLLVLCCFNQVGNGFGLIWPRLFDTLLGAGIAGLAVVLVLPDWQGRRLHQLGAASLAAGARYLSAILGQYSNGKADDLDYRLARRNAHNADAALAARLANARREPGHFRKDVEAGFRFLTHAHTLLNYLSALGAHRGETRPAGDDAWLHAQADGIIADLETLAGRLGARQVPSTPATAEARARALEAWAQATDDEPRRLLAEQLALISRALVPLGEAAAGLVRRQV